MNIIKATEATVTAHEATGHTTMREHEQAMKAAVTKAIQGDNRFMPSEAPAEAANVLKVAPCCIDVTTPDQDGTHHAIIHTHNGLVKHPFDYDHEEGKATMHDGAPNATERKSVYAAQVEQHENMIRAMAETISCRAGEGSGIKLAASEPWVSGKSVSYIYAPGGITTINAGFRRNESITCTVQVDEQTAKDLQSSFDFIAATEKQEPYADEDHESKKATLRFPARKVQFTYGTHRGEQGVIVSGAEPTSYGAEAVNGKVYASWSPEFATDAEYSKAKCKKGHWTFPDGVKGSASNPARLVAVNFVTGALTNKPAFKNMPNVKAKHTPPKIDVTIQASGTSEGVRKAWEIRHKNGFQPRYSSDTPHDQARDLIENSHAKSMLAKHAYFYHAAASKLKNPHVPSEESKDPLDILGGKEGNDHAKLTEEMHSHMNHMIHWASIEANGKKGIFSTDTTQSTTIQAAWSEAARAAALEARKHGSYAEYSDDAHEASKRALDLSRTAQGHHQDRKAHMEASRAHSLAATDHRYAARETDNAEVKKHHESHAEFHDSMVFAHAKLNNHMKEPAGEMATAAEVTAATDLIQAALQPDTNTIRAHWHIEKKGDKWHVVKANGQDEGASDSEEMAKKHLAALYANAPETKASEHYDENWNLIRASGTSEGVKKAWETRGHALYFHPEDGVRVTEARHFNEEEKKRFAPWYHDVGLFKEGKWTEVHHQLPTVKKIRERSSAHSFQGSSENQVWKITPDEHDQIMKEHHARQSTGKVPEKDRPHLRPHVSKLFDKYKNSEHAWESGDEEAWNVMHRHEIYSTDTTSQINPILSTILARNRTAQDAALTIALRTPEVKAAIDESHREHVKPNASMETILARKKEGESFLRKVMDRNPLATNQTALETMAHRNGVTASGTSEGVKKSWENRKMKSPSSIYPKGYAPTHGVYHLDALHQHGENAVAVSHHWSHESAAKEAAKYPKHVVIEYEK